MKLAVILVAIVGFGVSKRVVLQLHYCYNTIVSYMETIRWWPMCFVTDKNNMTLLWTSFEYWQHIYFQSLCGHKITLYYEKTKMLVSVFIINTVNCVVSA